MRIESGAKFVLIGDSITDADRDDSGEMTPWAPATGLGRGYVDLLNAMLATRHRERRIRIINRGISGNTMTDLAWRWKSDVIELEPHWLLVFIGINDVWRQFDVPLREELHVHLEVYRDTYRDLLTRTREALELDGLLLMAPYVLETNPQDAFRARMDEYGDVVESLAREFDATFIDAQSAVDELLEHHHPTEIAWDRIHLNTVGHMQLAERIYATLD